MQKYVAVRCHYYVVNDVLHGLIVDQDRNSHHGSWPQSDTDIEKQRRSFPVTPTEQFVIQDGKLIGLGKHVELAWYPHESERDIDAEVEQTGSKNVRTLVPAKQPTSKLIANGLHWFAHEKLGLLCHVYDQKDRLISCRWPMKFDKAKEVAQSFAEDFRRGNPFRLKRRNGTLVLDRRVPTYEVEWMHREPSDDLNRNFALEKQTLHERIDENSEPLCLGVADVNASPFAKHHVSGR